MANNVLTTLRDLPRRWPRVFPKHMTVMWCLQPQPLHSLMVERKWPVELRSPPDTRTSSSEFSPDPVESCPSTSQIDFPSPRSGVDSRPTVESSLSTVDFPSSTVESDFLCATVGSAPTNAGPVFDKFNSSPSIVEFSLPPTVELSLVSAESDSSRATVESSPTHDRPVSMSLLHCLCPAHFWYKRYG